MKYSAPKQLRPSFILSALCSTSILLASCSSPSRSVKPAPDLNGEMMIHTSLEKPTWRLNGIEQPDTKSQFRIRPRVGEYIVTATNVSASEDFKFFGIEETNTPPVIDGTIGDDWNDPPTAIVSAGYAKAEFRFVFVPDSSNAESSGILFVGAELNSVKTFNITIAGIEIEPRDKFTTSQSPYFFEGQYSMPTTFNRFSNPFPLEVNIASTDTENTWSENGFAVILPNPATAPESPGRQQLSGGATQLMISETPTKDPSYHTPLPVERPGDGVHKPDWLNLKAPWEGTYEVRQGYGFEAPGWTHQTIGNKNSANDFYSLDLDMPIGTPIIAPADGRIIQSNRRGDSYGNYIVIDHGQGIQTIYAHLDQLEYAVDKGTPEVQVKQGDFLGFSGESGASYPHLHFSVHTNARASHSGANVNGLTTCPEPLDGYYGIRQGHMLTSTNVRND